MADTSLVHQKLDQLRRRCDGLLDEALSFSAFARDLIEATVEIEEIPAAAIIELHSPTDQRIASSSGLEQISVDGFFSLDPDHLSLLIESLRQKRIQVASDRSVPEAGLKPHSIVMAPVPHEKAPLRVVELITLDSLNADHAAHLKEVAELLAAYVGRYLQEQAARSVPQVTEAFWKQFDLFLLKLQQSLDLKQTIAVAVNDGRTLIGCDRLSIALKHGRRTKIYGVSGQDGVQHRANLVRAMARVAQAVIRLGVPVTYRGTIEDLPPQLEVPLADYLAESRTRMVKMIPLREPEPLKLEPEDDRPRRRRRQRRLMGCLIVEQATESRPKPAVVERTELVVEHLETALHNCNRYESIFLLPLWRAVGRGIRWFKGRRLWTAAAILCLLTAAGLTLAFTPYDYRVEGAGQIMPSIQHEVFAPWDGDVQELLVESGQAVTAGQVLAILVSDDLVAEHVAAQTELEEKKKLVSALTQQQHVAQEKNDIAERVRIQGELVKAGIESEGAALRLQKIESRIEKLKVRSPVDGIIVTFQLRQLLQNRPVRRGELLLQVMQPEGPWRLELEVPEYRMGHLLSALEKSAKETLPVEYVMATNVETTHAATLTTIATRSNESAEEGTIVEVYADIDPKDLPTRNVGADVIAKINCGPKSLFYVLFGDIVEFLQRHLWL